MKAMILAAGRGERMRPLTDKTPKPLLHAGGKPIVQHTIEQLVAARFTEIVINIAHLGQQIKDSLGNGSQWGASIVFSDEGKTGLETAGGIINALPLLGEEPFLVVNGDIATNYDFSLLHNKKKDLAHLVLIANPLHHPEGDFHLSTTGKLAEQGIPKLTFSGIGVYNPALFDKVTLGKIKLVTLLRKAIASNQVSGEKFSDFWMDIGTPQRLIDLDTYYLQK
jgi:MurNAc alpha-1-phosphate uridylyltransferase